MLEVIEDLAPAHAANDVQPNCGDHLPMISLKGLRRKDPVQIQRIANEIGKAARDIGFFRICDHGIDQDLIEATYKASQTFFALPDAFKRQYYIGLSSNHRGYVPFTEKGDYPDEMNRSYEAFDLVLICHQTIQNIWQGTGFWGQMSGQI